MKYPAHPVEVRAADEADLEACLHIDDSYTSTHTWQVEPTRGEPGATPYTISTNVTRGASPPSVTFRPVRLPRAPRRPAHLPPPHPARPAAALQHPHAALQPCHVHPLAAPP